MDRRERLRMLEAARSAALEHDYGAAILQVDRVLEEYPNDPDGLMLKGNALDLSDRRQEALECYGQVLRLDPENVAALIDMGDSYSWSAQYKEAITFFDRALALLRQGKFYVNHREELESAYRGKTTALREGGRAEEASACAAEMHRVLGRVESDADSGQG